MDLEKLMAKLECAANSAMEWLSYNGMKLNSKKCHLLLCGHKFESICKIDHTMVVETSCQTFRDYNWIWPDIW